MTVHVNEIEAFWIVMSTLAVLLTIGELRAAQERAADVKRFNGSARGIVARANVADEWIRLYIQVALLLAAVPGIFSDRPTPLTPGLVLLLTVPPALIVNTYRARRVRGRLDAKLVRELARERAETDERFRELEERLT